MDSGKLIRRRNIVVLGKTGAGKSTVCNHIAGRYAFPVADSAASVTMTTNHAEVVFQEPDNIEYHFKVIDTVGVFDHKRTNNAVIKDIKKYFRNKIPEGLSLFVFVFKQGRFTPEEKATFDFLISNFKEHISPISALIITNCEQKSAASRQRIVEDFRTHEQTRNIAQFMKKGVYCVGFPQIDELDEEMQPIMEKRSKKDEKILRELAYSCGDMRLSRELFEESIWEKMKICPIF